VKLSLNEVLTFARTSPQTKSTAIKQHNDPKSTKIKQSEAKSEQGFRPSPHTKLINTIAKNAKIKQQDKDK
jgi:phenylalanyl-tRNA synthetase beta subunit